MRFLNGNAAAAHAVRLCRPDVVASYPITPQTELVELLSRFQADGEMDAEVVEPEGEHSAMSICIGASAAGGRVFTSSSSVGLFFMAEPYIRTAGLRLPVVMAIAGRDSDPAGVLPGQQDSVMFRDMGWIQLYAESCQEILDSIIMAYKLAEDPEILLPVNVCYEGFFLSYLSEGVDIPEQEKVDAFLPKRRAGDCRLDPLAPMTFPFRSGIGDILLTELRYKYCSAIRRATVKIDNIDKEFQQVFGRGYGGSIEEYRLEDAEIALVTMGSYSGTAKAAIDQKREKGVKVGLIKVRMLRPFPRERVVSALHGKKAVGVIDRNVCLGWGCGTVFLETKAVLSDMGFKVPMASFIDGLGGTDITVEHVERCVDMTNSAALRGSFDKEVTWLGLE